jgi:hypothetical protein
MCACISIFFHCSRELHRSVSTAFANLSHVPFFARAKSCAQVITTAFRRLRTQVQHIQGAPQLVCLCLVLHPCRAASAACCPHTILCNDVNKGVLFPHALPCRDSSV